MTIDEYRRRTERRNRGGGYGYRRLRAAVVVSVRARRAVVTELVLGVVGTVTMFPVVLPVVLAMMRVAMGERRPGRGEAREDRQQHGDETDGAGAMHGR